MIIIILWMNDCKNNSDLLNDSDILMNILKSS